MQYANRKIETEPAVSVTIDRAGKEVTVSFLYETDEKACSLYNAMVLGVRCKKMILDVYEIERATHA